MCKIIKYQIIFVYPVFATTILPVLLYDRWLMDIIESGTRSVLLCNDYMGFDFPRSITFPQYFRPLPNASRFSKHVQLFTCDGQAPDSVVFWSGLHLFSKVDCTLVRLVSQTIFPAPEPVKRRFLWTVGRKEKPLQNSSKILSLVIWIGYGLEFAVW